MPARGESVILLGSGGHALMVLDILRAAGDAPVAGVVTEDASAKTFEGLPVLGNEQDLPRLRGEGFGRVAIGVGGFTDNRARIRLYGLVKDLGFALVSAIHPAAIVARGVPVGEAAMLCAGVIVSPGSSIGANTLIYTNSLVEHQTRVGDHVLISSGVTVGANASIGDDTVLSMGCTVISGVRVGERTLVAAGAVVVKDIEPGSKVAGLPARPWEER
jgi:UDP-perosamine 4-acetyltransferase